ncbi:hypothetical protein CGLO_00066 [Colletotrichum gloeosporioides Cg-14]|uniref:NAD dependent epimerase/dehydratase n=1 Tax=Colletotrichum gloeosporioides (strain Cg-14) TaxID=1237896 RepID=T0L4V0_COLGC|nr:hypothetical protein CGLO_00066 [Colletotrichum gloeosporioides Cg-14]
MAGFGMKGGAVLYADGTDVDRRQCTRVVPMKVLCLGLCRTGTMSVRLALRSLGYLETYHMRSASTETPRDCDLWIEALRAKYDGQGRLFDRRDWDMLLGHCQAVCDFPAAAFAPELIAAYPNAKVILTTRDVDAWYLSTSKTINRVVHDKEFWWLSRFDWAFRLYRPMLLMLWDRFFNGDFEKRGKGAYEAHYAMVRSLVPPGRLLEFSVEDGWEPLFKDYY